MRRPKTAYELRTSQVHTPQSVVSFFWNILGRQRERLGRVLDMGAGDGRFAIEGKFRRYHGVEIDPSTSPKSELPPNARIFTGCAFRHQIGEYDACIGNPPYVRHHDLEPPWKKRIMKRLNKDLGIKIDGHGNLYLFFLSLAIIKTRDTGIVALIIPFEWVSRRSAASIREYIQAQKWNVSVYRFTHSIFDGVLTTASISIIDKKGTAGEWEFFDVLPDLTFKARKGISGNRRRILRHAPRDKIWARRGASPGKQKLFTLTEAERVEAGLYKTDVVPCVTSLRKVPRYLKQLNHVAFQKHLVEAGRRCWLIRSDTKKLSSRLKAYLNGIPKEDRQTYTCLNQEPWYAYENAPTPAILIHSGFTEFGPKVLVNAIGARAVGSVYGIYQGKRGSLRKLQSYLIGFDFEKRVVAHAKTLKKLEVRQVNGVLTDWLKKQRQ